MTAQTIFGVSLALMVLLFMAVIAWLLAKRQQRADLADVFWPMHKVVAAIVLYLALPTADSILPMLTMLLIVVWGARLATHLLTRQAGHPEDPRYALIRTDWGDRFDSRSVWMIFLPQAVMAWIIALSLVPIFSADRIPALGLALGLAISALGLIIEVAADLQLTAFQRTQAKTAVLRRGLWHHCRHPNYFGEWLFWLGVAYQGLCLGAWQVLLPIALLTFLLARFTGAKRMEAGISERRPDYADYLRTTPTLFPWRLLDLRRHGLVTALLVLTTILALILPLTSLAADSKRSRATAPGYQEQWFFAAHIGEREVGYHRFEVSHHPDGFTSVEAEAEFRYRILGVTVFSYDHSVREEYDDNLCLQKIRSQTKVQGKTTNLSGYLTEAGFVTGEPSVGVVPRSCLITFAYWSQQLLNRTELFNGQTGELMPVDIAHIDATNDPRAVRYRISADPLDITLTYNQAHEWVALTSALGKNNTLSYRLKSYSRSDVSE